MKVKLAEMNSNGELSGNKKGHLVTGGLAESGELQMHQNIMHDLNDGLFVGNRVRCPDVAIRLIALPTRVCRHCCPSNRASKTSTTWTRGLLAGAHTDAGLDGVLVGAADIGEGG